MDCVAGFGLGGSAIAMFGRVGGGIYTKAADVGADLAGKVVEDLPEDDPHNPGTIADNVGDNVGDVAGMGSDLFGSFGEASCAALLVGASSPAIVAAGWGALMFPLTISGAGIIVCLFTNFVATGRRQWKRLQAQEKRGCCITARLHPCTSISLLSPSHPLTLSRSLASHPLTLSRLFLALSSLSHPLSLPSLGHADLAPVKKEEDIEKVLKTQLLVSSVLMTPVVYFLSFFFLPAATCGECVGGFVISGVCSSPLKAFFCVAFGLW